MSIEVGNKLQGKISGITNFGAFIDLGQGKTGLVHISEVSDTFIKDINEVLKVGEEVTVKVMSIGDDGKIGLSIRRAVDKPAGETRPAPSQNRPYNNNGPKKSFNNNRGSGYSDRGGNSHRQAAAPKDDFDSLMSNFLKDSDDRLTSLKRNTEGKRGGRGGRRN